jgi:predicted transcriptional regulator
MLEDSIRHGQVLGTRSFSNKKFFIVTRQFLDRHIPSIFKMLREGARRTSEIAANENIDADAARAILYTLAENGDITEKKKDIFAIA